MMVVSIMRKLIMPASKQNLLNVQKKTLNKIDQYKKTKY